MAGASAGLHEDPAVLPETTKDFHRAIVSLMEELEAVDWYQQRVDASSDDQLKAILAHNRDEELEHAAMVLEWLRRRNPNVEAALKTYLFTTGEITAIEDQATGENGGGKGEGAGDGSLGIGSLKG